MEWLEHNTPERFQALPNFIETSGPSLFPRFAPPAPITPGSSSRDLAGVPGSSDGEGKGTLPRGRVLPPEPPIPKAKTNIGVEPASASVRYKSRCTCADVKARYSPEQEAEMDVFVPTPTPESHSLLEVAALHNEGWVTRSLDIVAAFLI